MENKTPVSEEKTARVTTTLEKEIESLLLEFADEETDGNKSFATRKILRTFLLAWKKNKTTS